MDKFLKNIYGVLFEPQATIENLIETKPIKQAFLIVLLLSVSACLLTYNAIFAGVLDVIFLVGNILGVTLSSLIFWLILAGFFEIIARIFSDQNNYKQLLTLMGFALLPWIFIAPLELLKINSVLNALSSLLEIVVWFWSIVLVFLSVKKLYSLTTKKTWLFLSIPFLGAFIALNWISQFFAIVINIF